MNNINYQILSLQEMHNHQTHMSSSSHFDLTSSHNDFLEQMLSSVPSSSASFPWTDDHGLPPPTPDVVGHLEEQSSLLDSKQRQNLISNGTAKALLIQQQLLLSSGLCSPMGAGNGLQGDHNDVVGGSSKSTNTANDASIKSLFNGGFSGSVGQFSNQPPHFHHPLGGALEAQNYGAPVEAAAAGQPKQRVRARRGQATDPHSIAERLRREKIAERMKGLQELVPNANKTDKASMLDEIIDYVKFLQLQVKVLSMSRLGGAATVAPLFADISSQGKRGNGTQTASSSNDNDAVTVTEQQVAKLLEEDMGSAMQYLQGKGLCLMPISLATAISTATCHSKNPMTSSSNLYSNGISKSPLLNGEAGPPTSPSMSGLTVQSATIGGNNSGGEVS